MRERTANNTEAKYDFVNSRALFVLKIITLSFAILAFIVITTAMLTKWITDLNRSIKESNSKIARANARLNKFRKARIKHILKQRRLQRKNEKAEKKRKKSKKPKIDGDYDDTDGGNDIDDINDIDDDDLSDFNADEKDIDNFDNELRDIMLETSDDEEI